MNREQLIAAGVPEGVVDSIMAMYGTSVTALRTQISNLETQNTQLQADSTELATLKQQNMTAEQLQQQAIDQANAEKEKYEKMILGVKAREKLLEGGLQADEIDDDLISLMLGSDEADTVKKCDAYTSRIKSKLEAKETQLREELLKGTNEPPKPDGTKAKNISLQEQIAKDLGEKASAGSGGFADYLKGE